MDEVCSFIESVFGDSLLVILSIQYMAQINQSLLNDSYSHLDQIRTCNYTTMHKKEPPLIVVVYWDVRQNRLRVQEFQGFNWRTQDYQQMYVKCGQFVVRDCKDSPINLLIGKVICERCVSEIRIKELQDDARLLVNFGYHYENQKAGCKNCCKTLGILVVVVLVLALIANIV